NEGIFEFISRTILFVRRVSPFRTYHRWISQFETLTGSARKKMIADIIRWNAKPLVSFVMTIGDVKSNRAGSAICSLQRQLYSKWELCIAYSDATPTRIQSMLRRYALHDHRIRLVSVRQSASLSDNLNLTFSVASGEFIALICAEDELAD